MNTATHTGLRLATAGNGGSFSVVKGVLSAAVHVKGPTASCRIVRQVHKFQKAGERDRFSCQVLGYGCHPHRGMTTVPQRTYSYLTEAITRCHQGHTHPTGSGILVYDSITSFIIQDSGVNARKILLDRTSSAILCFRASATDVCLSCCAAGRDSCGRVNNRLLCSDTLQLRANAVPNLRTKECTPDAKWCRNLLTGLSPLPRQS